MTIYFFHPSSFFSLFISTHATGIERSRCERADRPVGHPPPLLGQSREQHRVRENVRGGRSDLEMAEASAGRGREANWRRWTSQLSTLSQVTSNILETCLLKFLSNDNSRDKEIWVKAVRDCYLQISAAIRPSDTVDRRWEG